MTSRQPWKGPLANSYASAVLLVVFALVPYLALSTALTPLMPVMTRDIGLSEQSFQLTTGMANAAYAFGTVAAVQLAVHLPGRRMLVLYASLLVVGSVLAATAWTPGLYVAGHITQGLATSLMLIAAVPPLVIGWPASRQPSTAITMNLCIFGAVALGPVIGGVQAGAGDWRPLFWIVAGVAGLALLMSLLTFEDEPPADPEARWDWVAQALAGVGCAAAFFGASELETHRLLSVIVFLPLLAGAAMVLALVVYQYLLPRPLIPVRALASTLPVAGVAIAMAAGATSVAIVELVQTVLASKTTPTHAAMLFWPEFGAAFAMALLFGAVVRTRWVVTLPLAGMAALCGGAAVLTGVAAGPDALVAVGSGLVGLGVGASVSPALFAIGYTQRAPDLQRIYALVELLRGTAAFMLAPILLHFATNVAGGPNTGTKAALWICFGLAAGGGLFALALGLLGRVRLGTPRLEPWLEGDGVALESPPLAAGVREGRAAATRDAHSRGGG